MNELTFEDWQEIWLRQQENIRKSSEIQAGDLPKPPPLFHSLLPERTLTMLSAEPYSGKTMLCLDMAICLANDLPLFGRFQPRESKRVLFMGQDAPSWDYAEQIRKLLRGHNLGQEQNDIDLILNEGLVINDPSFLKLLEQWHHVSAFDVIFLDTLQSLHSADENSTREMGGIMTILKHIRERFHCAVIFTHHDTKPVGDERSAVYRARGSSTIAGSIDFYFSLRRQSSERIRCGLPKGRGAEKGESLDHFDIIETEEDGNPVVRLVSDASTPVNTIQAEVLNELDQPRTRAELIERLPHIKSSAIDNTLAMLKRSGKIQSPRWGTYERAQNAIRGQHTQELP